MLGSVAAVDLVCIYDEDTPEQTLHLLRPDMLMKGADYTIGTVVGAEFVQGYGGQVILANLAAGSFHLRHDGATSRRLTRPAVTRNLAGGV